MPEKYTHRHAVEQWKHYGDDPTGYVSDDSSFSNKAIVTSLLESRAALVKLALRNRQAISEFMVQTLGCVEVDELDRAECPCAPASGCYWLRSKEPLPETIKTISVTGIVANTEMPRFTFIKWDRFQYIPKSRVRSMASGNYYTIRDTGDGAYLYLYGNRFLKQVTVSAIFENPMTAAAYPSCGVVDETAKCSPLDVDFYTDSWLVDQIIATTWQKIAAMRQSARPDDINDDKPAITQRG